MSELHNPPAVLASPLDRLLAALLGRYVDPARLRAWLAAHRAWVAVGALTIVGLLLRAYHLGFESFWFDEADIVAQAQAPALQILTDFTKAGANGPLYTLLLHFWIELVGTREVAVRALPMLCGTATIPVIYLVGRRLFTPTVGLLAALLLTVSPFHIWHSQDAKMYTLVVLVILLSLGLYLVALDRDRPVWWAAFVVATWVALYAHILAALMVAAEILVTPLLLCHLRAGATSDVPAPAKAGGTGYRRRLWLVWGVLLLPVLPIALERLRALIGGDITAGWLTPISLGDMLSVLFVKFAVNRADPPWETIGALWLGGLAALGLLTGLARRGAGTPTRTPWIAAALLWLVPIVLFWLATLRVPLFEPRYMIIVLPFYLFFVAGGLAWLAARRRLLLWIALLGAALPTAAALAGVNYGPYGQKEDWRSAVDFVRQHERLRDVVIVYPGYLVTAVDYYRNAQDLPTVPVVTIPELDTAHFGARELNDALTNAIANHERAWLIISPPRAAVEDPDQQVLHWFQYNWLQFEKQVYNGVEVYGFSFNGQPRSWFPKPSHPQEATYADGFHFEGYIYELRNGATAAQNASWLPLTFYWRSPSVRLTTDLRFVVELVDAAGQVRVRAGPLGPLGGFWPTFVWAPDLLVIDYHDIFLPGDLPPGSYTVRLRVVDGAHPDTVLPLQDGAPDLTLDTPLTVVPWTGK